MNFYKHHIGDYAQATAHLSFVEDAAYSRLIRKYYADEKPLPADVKAAQRLVGARSREEREAVQSVLDEFFTLEADGWHNKRCDAELTKANAQAETNRRIAEEREARRRERQQHGSSHESLHATVNDSLKSGEHDSLPSREPSQTPDTRLQTPDSISPSGMLNTSDASRLHPPASADGQLPGVDPPPPPEDPGPPPCPHERVIALYAKHLPGLQQPRVWDGARAEAMRVRWRQCAKPTAFGKGYASVDDGLAFWDRFFRYVASCPALRDGIARPNSASRWFPDLPWLLKAENFAKVIEGKYAE